MTNKKFRLFPVISMLLNIIAIIVLGISFICSISSNLYFISVIDAILIAANAYCIHMNAVRIKSIDKKIENGEE